MVAIPPEDHIAIQELTHSYAFHADRKDWHSALDLFVEDAVFDETSIGVDLMPDKAAIRAYFFGPTIGAVEYFVHFVTNHIIQEFSGDRAKGICYVLGIGKFTDGTEVQIVGFKNDEYVKVGGQWKFQKRVLQLFAPPKGL